MRRLPDRPSLEHLRNEAKALVRARGTRQPQACGVLRHLHRFEAAAQDEVRAAAVRLTEAQYAVALSYGFANWGDLCAAVRASEGEHAEAARLLARAQPVITAKGPATNYRWSAHEEAAGAAFRELSHAGRAGVRAAAEMAHASSARARPFACILLGFSGEPAALAEVLRLLGDPSHAVRVTALRSVARAIHPEGRSGRDFMGFHRPASRVPAEVRYLLPLTADPHVKVRWYAVRALAAYAGLGDAGVQAALRAALADGTHKIVHEGARALRVACPGCRQVPPPIRTGPD